MDPWSYRESWKSSYLEHGPLPWFMPRVIKPREIFFRCYLIKLSILHKIDCQRFLARESKRFNWGGTESFLFTVCPVLKKICSITKPWLKKQILIFYFIRLILEILIKPVWSLSFTISLCICLSRTTDNFIYRLLWKLSLPSEFQI